MKCPVGSLSIYLFLFNLNGGKEGGFLIKKIKYYILWYWKFGETFPPTQKVAKSVNLHKNFLLKKFPIFL